MDKRREKQEAASEQATRPNKRPDAFPPCSRCGERPCSKHTWKRKWAGGVGLCLRCYDAIRKLEKGKPASLPKPAPAKDQNQPTSPTKIEATQGIPAGNSVLLKTINSRDHTDNPTEAIAKAHEFIEGLKAMEIPVLIEMRISIIPEEIP